MKGNGMEINAVVGEGCITVTDLSMKENGLITSAMDKECYGKVILVFTIVIHYLIKLNLMKEFVYFFTNYKFIAI